MEQHEVWKPKQSEANAATSGNTQSPTLVNMQRISTSDALGPKFIDLFKQQTKPNFQLKCFKPDSGNIKKVEIPVTTIEEGSKEWESTLVGYFLDKKLPYTLVQNAVFGLWENKGLVDMLAIGDGYYFFKYVSKTDSDAILEGGLWHIASQLQILKKWEPRLKLMKESQSTIPLW